ncbi:MAG: hypothetical protein PWQ82_904 [Thermosediminibacterales bacterium]|nr:hypothetical protein [Thermosediminibacterales bacterium]MDK2835445.1 hypothetical protein [Thermosediminibacterales bacterium]
MKVVGLIAEYNPFHNGHLYHLKKTKKITEADFTICVMSGNFVQRGEPALVDKWARTKMALSAGIDLVIELPVCYAVGSAETFAFGSIKTLEATGVVDSICFGSESGDLRILKDISKVLLTEPPEFIDILKKELKKGLVYPKARELALKYFFESYKSIDTQILTNLIDTIKKPNNLLGIEYLKALSRLNSNITPLTIKRISNRNDCDFIKGKITSASKIRSQILLRKKLTLKTLDYLPEFSQKVLLQEFKKGKGPIGMDDLTALMLGILRKSSLEQLRCYRDVSEGLENRILRFSKNSTTIHELLMAIKTKRYTLTRLQRILIHILLGIKQEYLADFDENGGPRYLRILGFSSRASTLLKAIKKKSELPVIVKTAHYKKIQDHILHKMIYFDLLSSDIYSLFFKNPFYRKGGIDFYKKVIIKS